MDPLVCGQRPGARFSIAAKVMGSADGVLQCMGLSPVQNFVVCGAPAIGPGLFTFYDVQRAEQDSVCLVIEGLTEIHGHPDQIPLNGVSAFDFCVVWGAFQLAPNFLE